MKTLVNVDTTELYKLVGQTKAATVNGKVAVEHIQNYLGKNVLTAKGIGACISAIESQSFDPNIVPLKEQLESLVSVEHLRVSETYESIMNNRNVTFFGVGVEAANVLAELYQYNAQMIIDKINGGALDSWKYNSDIAGLIRFADAAARDRRRNALPSTMKTNVSDIELSMVPVLELATLSDGTTLTYIDGIMFLVGKRGGMTSVTKSMLSGADLPGEILNLIDNLDILEVDGEQTNILKFKASMQSALSKYGIDEVKIDLLAPAGSKILVGTRAMNVDKFREILNSDKDKLVAALTMEYREADVISAIISTLTTVTTYSDTMLSGNQYVYKQKMVGSSEIIYNGKLKSRFLVVSTSGGSVISVNTYDTAFKMLSDDTLITNTKAHKMVQELYKDSLDSEVANIDTRKKVAMDLSSERKSYESLRKQLQSDIEVLESNPDANPEKLSKLSDLLDKAESNITKIDSEIKKLEL